MKGDPNYWKEAYKDIWETSQKREEKIRKIIEKEGFDVDPYGLGAEDDSYIPGKPEKHGHEKADPDLKVKDTETYIEVTGTDKSSVNPSDDIWIRPDKIKKKIDNPEMDIWLVHVLDNENLTRCINLKKDVAEELYSNTSRVNPYIRGRQEEYVSIPADDDVVEPFDNLIGYLEDTN